MEDSETLAQGVTVPPGDGGLRLPEGDLSPLAAPGLALLRSLLLPLSVVVAILGAVVAIVSMALLPLAGTLAVVAAWLTAEATLGRRAVDLA